MDASLVSDLTPLPAAPAPPQSLARDAAILIKGGYTLESAAAFDQFLFSPHVEAVALFSKTPDRTKRPIFGRKV